MDMVAAVAVLRVLRVCDVGVGDDDDEDSEAIEGDVATGSSVAFLFLLFDAAVDLDSLALAS